MEGTMKTLALHLMILLALLLAEGCDELKNNGIASVGGSETVCMWIAADKDTYASFGRTGEEGDLTFGRNGTLAIAVGPVGRKRAYLNFPHPNFPGGTEITFAKIELYHPGKNEDGTSDDIQIDISSIRTEPWNPATLSWNNRPDRSAPYSSEFSLMLRSQAWSGTGDIRGFIEDVFDNPSSHYGFMLSMPDGFFSTQIEKGFYSNNDIRRKQDDLGLSPRLLLKVKLPAGKTMNDITLPFLATDNDLGNLPRPIRMVNIVQTDEFPDDWKVSPNL
jgi:hypothetical protein